MKSEEGKMVRLIDSPKHKENPFIAELFNIKTKGKMVSLAKNKTLVDTITGETTEGVFMAIQREVDKEEFVKIFHSSLRELFDLEKATLKVLAYLMSVTQWNDKLLFDLEGCKEYTGYKSKDTVFKAMRELVEKSIIAKSMQTNVYFINPTVFYKGDRLLVVKEYRIRKSKQVDKNQTLLPFGHDTNLNDDNSNKEVQSDSKS